MKSFKNVPNKYKTFDRCMEAVKEDVSNLQYVPDNILENPDNVYTMITFSTDLITKIPKKYITSDVIYKVLYRLLRTKDTNTYNFVRKYIIKNFGIKEIPQQFLTNSFLIEYIENNYISDQFVRDLQSEECATINNLKIIDAIIKKNPEYYPLIDAKYRGLYIKNIISANNNVLNYIPTYLLTDDVVEYMIDNFISIRYIPEKYVTRRLCKIYFEHDPKESIYMPEKYITRKMKKFIIDSNYFKYMNPEWFDYFLAKRALSNNIEWIKYVPKNYITEKIVDKVIEDDLFALIQYCPITKETAYKAVYNNMEWLEYLPKEYITTDMIIGIIKTTNNLSILNYLDKEDMNEAIAFTAASLTPYMFANYSILDEYRIKVFQYYEITDKQIKFAFKDNIIKYANYNPKKHYVYYKQFNKVVELDIHI